MTTFPAHLILSKQTKTLLTPAQKTFNRLKTKIKALQKKQEEVTRELDESLQFYYARIVPEEDVLRSVLAERAKIAYRVYKTSKAFSKKDLKILRELILEDVNVVCTMNMPCSIPNEIKKIFEELNEVNYEELYSKELANVKNKMEKKLKDLGVEIDLAQDNKNQSQEEIVRNLSRLLGKAFEDQEALHRETQTTNKQREKEEKKRAFEETQKKSLNSIYKQLVRVLHPDLEQDSEQKIWKEELIRKLTSAYAKNDLYALLAIEMEWVKRSTGQVQTQTNEQFEIYNAILKDQIKTQQANIDMLLLHPKYIPIQRFYNHHFDGMVSLKSQYDLLKNDVLEYQKQVTYLQTQEAVEFLKSAIKDRQARPPKIDFFWDGF